MRANPGPALQSSCTQRLCRLSLDDTLHDICMCSLAAFATGSIINPATPGFPVYPLHQLSMLSTAERHTHKQYIKALSWMSAQLSAAKGKGCC